MRHSALETGDGRRETGDWRLETGDWRLKPKDWRLKTEDWRLETEDWRLKTEDWRLKTEDCRLKTEDWRLKTEDWRLETEDWRLKTEDWRLKNEDWRLKTEDWRLKTGDWRLKTGYGRLETGDWQGASQQVTVRWRCYLLLLQQLGTVLGWRHACYCNNCSIQLIILWRVQLTINHFVNCLIQSLFFETHSIFFWIFVSHRGLTLHTYDCTYTGYIWKADSTAHYRTAQLTGEHKHNTQR
jgi:hypothetical protein